MRRLFRSDEGGQSLIEFALVLPLLLLIITGLFDVARATWQENTLAYAAREGTRYAIVHGSASVDGTVVYPSSYQPVVDVVRDAAVGVPSVSVSFKQVDGTTTCVSPPTLANPCFATVRVTWTWHTITAWPLIPNTFNFDRSTTMRMMSY